jgi:DNA-binding NarL/FixJ family response regulator
VLRAGIRQTLEKAQDIRVIGEAGNGAELLELLAGSPTPDLLLLDIQMPDFDVFEAVPRLKTAYPRMKILIVTAHGDRTSVNRLVELGIDGYLLKEESLRTYPNVVRRVAEGEPYVSPGVVAAMLTRDSVTPPALSPRELQVLELVAQGLTSGEIGMSLGLSAKTVDTHAERVCRKLSANNRTAAVARAIELGWIDRQRDADDAR